MFLIVLYLGVFVAALLSAYLGRQINIDYIFE